ncbi:8-oxoguanine DNA glycosylase [Salinirubellus salinus]|jgi:N-glycosylase/DNA lyase|uniref:DNA-(apurinic or apyrimidinic site) lyase n=1 Tax=Salinirubellus salinus TaxID=1364945 RepID=A0A9E7R5U1_9EURY|nr:8-oxoguanine DNA glycosylase [Salinirubellus salinus]UWM56006.1 8-oxoguanine DNA glycosylase [Salinirubellus salinus]
MHEGHVPGAEIPGGFDLQATVESGQTYLWDRADDAMYEDGLAWGGDHWYHTVLPATETATNEPELLRTRWDGERLHWTSTTPEAPDHLERLLRLDDDLDAIVEATPRLPLLDRAFERYRGMRLVRDPSFGSLISFICSAQMRVERIHGMQMRLAREYGDRVTVDGRTYHAFPTPEQLAAATEADLRDLSLGYRAPYVKRTAEMVADGEAHPDEAIGLPYEEARESLTRFVGVGDKVADCVLLFALDFLEAVPLDTWIQTAIAEYYPDCEKGNYAATSRAIRDRFGGEYAGYAQTYVFFYLRTGGE